MSSTATRSRRATGRESARPGSIREVCLVGRRPEGWGEGDRVALAGRSYRVVDESPLYARLRPDGGPDVAG